MPEPRPTAFEFPCSFPIKVIGHDREDFPAIVTAILRKHVPSLREEEVVAKPSSGGKYVSLTATFTAESMEQLDALYLELTRHERVIMVL
jgi:putative lipoic acid-binding regulatory protein